MRDAGPVLGVFTGLALLAANRWWPSFALTLAGTSCVILSMLAGAALHPLSAFERARLARSFALNARAEAATGYWRIMGRWTWELFRRFWFLFSLGILVSVYVLGIPAERVWTIWLTGGFVTVAAVLLIATLNHIFLLWRAGLRATDASAPSSEDPR